MEGEKSVYGIDQFLMDEKTIVRYNTSKKQFEFFNRWNLSLKMASLNHFCLQTIYLVFLKIYFSYYKRLYQVFTMRACVV